MIKFYNISINTPNGVYMVINFTRPDGHELRLMTLNEVPPPNSELPYLAFSKNEKIIFLSKERNVGFSLLSFINNDFKLNYTVDKLNEINFNKVLFGLPIKNGNDVMWEPLKGEYKIKVYMAGDNRDSIKLIKGVFGGESYGLLGTDDNGRDLAQGLLFGFPVALAIGFFTSIVTTAIGASLGIVSGYKGGRIDEIIQRISDVVYNFPFLPIIILLVFIISRIPGFPRLIAIFGAIVALGWPGLTILIRSMVLSIKQSQFIEAAKAIGASDRRIMFRHIFPNLAPFIFAQMIFFTPGAILTEAALSFLGLGDPSIPTWGQIIQQSYNAGAALNGWWWWVLPPGLLIMFAAITFVFIALGMEPIVNPKLQER
jgi:peptide/nickel transport system permease protein